MVIEKNFARFGAFPVLEFASIVGQTISNVKGRGEYPIMAGGRYYSDPEMARAAAIAEIRSQQVRNLLLVGGLAIVGIYLLKK